MATSSSAARIPPRPGGARPSAAPVGSSRRRRRWRAVAVVLVAAALGTAPLATFTWPAAADERSDAVDAQQQAQQQQAELTASLEGVSAELGQAYLDLQSARTALSTAEASPERSAGTPSVPLLKATGVVMPTPTPMTSSPGSAIRV